MRFLVLLCIQTVFCLIIPGLFCLLLTKKPEWMRGVRRQMLVILGYSAFSYLFINSLWLIPHLIFGKPMEGPPQAFAVLFGWLYLWITSLPLLIVYGLYRRRTSAGGTPEQIRRYRFYACCAFLASMALPWLPALYM